MLELLVNWTERVRSAMAGLFNRPGATAVAGDLPWVAYELRPISRMHDAKIVIGDKSNLTGYYTDEKINKIILVRTDSVSEYTFSDVGDFKGSISELNAAKISVIEFWRGIIKALLFIAIFIVLLQFIAYFGRAR